MTPPRTPWRPDFPQVIVHSQTELRDFHPFYALAKSGDEQAALSLAEDLLSPVATAFLADLTAHLPAILLPITALETTGFNAIPDAMAQVLGRELRLEVSAGQVVQTNRVGHTRAKSYNRLVTPADFEGEVEADRHYILVDDHVGLGGTLANLKGYIEESGGVVLAMTTLTESRDARQIALRPETLRMLRERHGDPLETFWKEQFGHGLECLTDVEGQVLTRAPTIDVIRDRLAQATVEARGRGIEPAIDLGR